jgi:hypothetical protein
VAFLDVQDAIHGAAKPVFAPQGEGAGTFDVAAAPDGLHEFSANEYGVVADQRGNVGVIAIEPDASGRVTHPETVVQMPLGDVVPSLTLSHDALACMWLPNSSRKRAHCKSRALATPASASKTACRPRERPRDRSPALLESDPDHAFKRSIPSGGESAVGLLLFDQDRLLAVANSNRFANSNGSLAFLSVSQSGAPSEPQILPAGGFPRNLSLAPDGHSIFLTNYTSRSIERVTIPSSLVTVASRN